MPDCDEGMGFLPCSDSVGGSVFLMAVYGYLLLQGANLISDGSELLLEILDPGLIGALVLPVLGAMPDAAIILVSGLGGTKEEVQEEVAVGMGTLAGSTIMLLTIAWGGSLWVGRCDLTGPGGTARDKTLTHNLDLQGTGVTTDQPTRINAYIMIASGLLYLVPQVPAWAGVHSGAASLAGCIMCFLGLVAYCTYQLVSPTLQKKKMEEARRRMVRFQAVSNLHRMAHSFGGLINKDGSICEQAAYNIFTKFDSDNSGTIDMGELRALLLGLCVSHSGSVHAEDDVLYWMRSFDDDGSGTIDRQEFMRGMTAWVSEKHHATPSELRNEQYEHIGESAHMPMLGSDEEGGGDDDGALADGDMSDDEDEDDAPPPTKSQIVVGAIWRMAAGAALVGLFADPMVSAVGSFSKASGIPSFFVSFVVTPFASNASELVSSIYFAARKKKKNISLTYSQVYGAVTMNNLLCLGIFLGLGYARDLEWVFSSEVTVVVAAVWALGLAVCRRTTFAAWEVIPALALYPASIALVIFLQRGLGWG